MSDLPQEGKFRIGTVGQKKSGTSKKGNDYVVYVLQFENDPQWYDTFWTLKIDPAIGMELEGKKSHDDQYDSYKFEINRPGGKASWNPAGANATVMTAAVALVHNWLTMDPKNKADWESKRRAGEAPLDHYIRTVGAIARLLKEDVVKMGGTAEVQSNNTARTSDPNQPPASSYTPEVEPFGESNVDLS